MALSVQEAAPALQRGASGVEVQILQHRLNRIGALLDCDGDFGSVTEGAVKEAQQRAGLPATGIADAATWAWLEAQPEPSDSIPVEAVTFLMTEEVGGRQSYERHVAIPQLPGVHSGVTKGPGYDPRLPAAEDH